MAARTWTNSEPIYVNVDSSASFVKMTEAITSMNAAVTKFGEVFVRFNTSPLKELAAQLEFAEDVRQLQEIDGTYSDLD